ncbi:MAG: putative membrane protein [Pseudohongiellaceae bacterium]|jgi:uncharacterized membrane protein
MSSPLDTKSIIARNITLACYVLLILMMIITSLPSMLPEGTSPWLVLIIKLVPLLIIMPGLLLDQLRAFIWLCFIVLFYFTQSVVETFLSKGASIDYLITFLTVTQFLSAMFYIKWARFLGRGIQ